MARRPEGTKHPAVARGLKEITKRSRKTIKEVTKSELWEELTPDHKRFLSAYLLCRDYRKAAEMTGIHMDWLAEQEEDPRFHAVVRQVLAHPLQLGEILIMEMVPMTLLELRALVEQDENKGVKLNAIKHVHNLAGLVSTEGVGVNVANAVTVVGWDKPPPAVEGEVIDHAGP